MRYILLLLLAIIVTSCTTLIINSSLKNLGAFDDTVKLYSLTNKKKEVVFIGMHHIGRLEFYNDVSSKIDSLQRLNFIIFYESVTENEKTDSIEQDISYRKIRKLIGFIPEQHLDTIDNKLFGKYKYSGKYDLLNQPEYLKMNVDTTIAVQADISLSKLIKEYEKKYSKIQLDNCDIETSLSNTNYNCKRIDRKTQKIFFDEFILDYRDKHLADLIQNSETNKIAVIYGKTHLSGMVVQLRKLDSAWDYK